MPAITQAFVLGAGLGIRLRPLTDDLPKPLVPIFQKPLITFALDHLIDAGVTSFFVNTHHRPEWFAGIFPRSSYRERSIQFFHEPDLLETAGGIANIAGAIAREPLLVYNGDILADVPLAPLLEGHARAGNMVTLALRSNAEPKQIAFDPETGLVVDIRNRLGRGIPDEFLFTGIYIVDPAFVGLLERGVKRSVIPHFLEVIRGGGKVGGVVVDRGQWWDVGNRAAYLELHRELRALNFPGYPVDDPAWKAPVHGTAVVESGARVSGGSVISRDCRVGSGAVLEDTILWPGAQIASRSRLTGCIVCTRKKVSGTHHNVDL